MINKWLALYCFENSVEEINITSYQIKIFKLNTYAVKIT